MNFLYEHFYGLANLSVWGYIVVTLLCMHVTLIAVTLYYHRDQAHRSVDLHPVYATSAASGCGYTRARRRANG